MFSQPPAQTGGTSAAAAAANTRTWYERAIADTDFFVDQVIPLAEAEAEATAAAAAFMASAGGGDDEDRGKESEPVAAEKKPSLATVPTIAASYRPTSSLTFSWTPSVAAAGGGGAMSRKRGAHTIDGGDGGDNDKIRGVAIAARAAALLNGHSEESAASAATEAVGALVAQSACTRRVDVSYSVRFRYNYASLDVAPLYELIWRRVLVDPRFYSSLIRSSHVGTMLDCGQVTQRYVLAPDARVGTLELLLSATLAHLSQIGSHTVSTYIRVEAQHVLMALLNASKQTLQHMAAHTDTANMLFPFLDMREVVPPMRMLNALVRAMRFVYAEQMLTIDTRGREEPDRFAAAAATSQEACCQTKTLATYHNDSYIQRRLPTDRDLYAERTWRGGIFVQAPSRLVPSHPAYPFLSRNMTRDDIAAGFVRDKVYTPLVDLRTLHCNFAHDATLDGLPKTEAAKATAIAITAYPETFHTHSDIAFNRYRHDVTLSAADGTVAAIALPPLSTIGGTTKPTRTVYRSDYWIRVCNALCPPPPHVARPLQTVDYYSQNERALLWVRAVDESSLHTPLSQQQQQQQQQGRGGVFSGLVRDPRQRYSAIDVPLVAEIYATWWVHLFTQMLALCMDSAGAFAGKLSDPSFHVLRSCGGQVLEAHTRFEQSVLTALQCFEQHGAVASLFALASASVASALHSVTQQPTYAPSMFIAQSDLVSLSHENVGSEPSRLHTPLAAPTRYGDWFREDFVAALLHARANNTDGHHHVQTQLCVPTSNYRFAQVLRTMRVPPHLHVMVAWSERVDDSTVLYQTPEFAIESGVVRMAKLEMTADLWQSIVSLLPECMAIAVARTTGMISATEDGDAPAPAAAIPQQSS